MNKQNNILKESISEKVYHFTNATSFLKFVENDSISLSQCDPNSTDDMGNNGYLFYLSLTRNFNSRVGYVGAKNNYNGEFIQGNSAYDTKDALNVRIEFDGNKLNRKFKGGPVEWIQYRKQWEDTKKCISEYGEKLTKKMETSGIKARFLLAACRFYTENNIPIDDIVNLFKEWHTYVERIDKEKAQNTNDLSYDEFISILNAHKENFGIQNEINESDDYGYYETDDDDNSFFKDYEHSLYKPTKFSQEYMSLYSETEDRIYSNETELSPLSEYITNVDILIPLVRRNSKGAIETIDSIKRIFRSENYKKFEDKIKCFLSLTDFNDYTRRNGVSIDYILEKYKAIKKDESIFKHENSIGESALGVLAKFIFVINYPSDDIYSKISENMTKCGLDRYVTLKTFYKNGEKVSLTRGRPSKELEVKYENVNLKDYVLNLVKNENIEQEIASFSKVRGYYHDLMTQYLGRRQGEIKLGIAKMLANWCKMYGKAVNKKANEFYNKINSCLNNNSSNKDTDFIFKELDYIMGTEFMENIFNMFGINKNVSKNLIIKLLKLNLKKIKNIYKNKYFNYDEFFIFQSKLRKELTSNKETRGKKSDDATLAGFFKGKNRYSDANKYMNTMSESIKISRNEILEMINECINKIEKDGV